MKKTFLVCVLSALIMTGSTVKANNEVSINSNASGMTLNIHGLILDIADIATSEGKYRRKVDYTSNVPWIDLGFNYLRTWGHDYMSMDMGKSHHFGINLVDVGMAFDRAGIVGISSGITLAFNTYRFAGRYSITTDDIRHTTIPLDLDNRATKSRIQTLGFRMPLYLDLNISNASLSVGGYGGVVLEAKTKQKNPKIKSDIKYINNFEYGVSARVRWDNISVFANYPLSTLLRNGKGPGVDVITVGMGFGF